MADTALAPLDFQMSVDSTSSDPASSLRAAALLTLKSKRRRNPVNQTTSIAPLNARPPAPRDMTVQLDYGNEDGVSRPTSTASQEPSYPPALLIVEKSSSEGASTREEGEISDEEEEPPPTTNVHLEAPPPRFESLESESLTSIGETEATHEYNIQQRWALFSSRNASLEDVASSISQPHSLAGTEIPPSRVTAHARPGVSLDISQYEVAKDLVLDLLGWGVHPEYLVECGLSRETLFHVFGELNLRMPHNLDTSGLVPYIPDDRLLDHRPGMKSAIDGKISRSGQSLFASSDESLANGPPHSTPRTHSDPQGEAPSIDAITLEQQRRQELLARKAVIVSRKLKQTTATKSGTSVGSQPVVDASNPVDDFLKSIEAIPSEQDVHMAPPLSAAGQDELMDTDIGPSQADTLTSTMNVDPFLNSPVFATSSVGCPPSSTESITTCRTASSAGDSVQTSRRKQKRPVATDFDDFYTNSHSIAIHTTFTAIGNTNRITFAGLNQRRCVIDISDSEGDTDDETIIHEVQKLRRSTRASPFPTRVQSLANTPNGATTPLIHSVAPVAVQPARTASLARKEIEIQRMKELIAKMEQNRKSGRTVATKSASPPVKQEEGDLSPLTPTPSTPSTPNEDKSSNGDAACPSEINQKDKVMADVHQQPDNSEMDINQSEISSPGSGHVGTAPPPFQGERMAYPASERSLNDANEAATSGPAIYTSLFKLYPSLASPSDVDISPTDSGLDAPLQTSSMRTTSYDDDSLASYFPSRPPTPDLKQLRLSVISKLLDPSKRICRYEVPGGGVCRDSGCEDIHLSRISGWKGMEPTDEDTARFLVNVLPASWLAHHNATYAKLHSVLQHIRSKASDMALEQRVAQTLATFGPS